MRVHKASPDPGLHALLPGARFMDAYTLNIGGRPSARDVAARMFATSPGWVAALMKVRDRVMAPFGVRTAARSTGVDSIGVFPTVSDTPARFVGGFDDRHLDFRVVVGVEPVGPGSRVTITTIVRTNNRLGRAYLAAITPFHRLIVRSILAQAASEKGHDRPAVSASDA